MGGVPPPLPHNAQWTAEYRLAACRSTRNSMSLRSAVEYGWLQTVNLSVLPVWYGTMGERGQETIACTSFEQDTKDTILQDIKYAKDIIMLQDTKAAIFKRRRQTESHHT